MKTIKYDNDKISFIISLTRKLTSFTKTKWAKKELLIGKIPDGGIIEITFPSDATGIFSISADDDGYAYLKNIEKKELMDVIQSDIEKSVFKSLGVSDVKNSDYLNIGKNLDVFNELSKTFKTNGFNSVSFFSKLIPNVNNIMFNEPTLIFYPYDVDGNGPNFSITGTNLRKLGDKYRELKGFVEFYACGNDIPTVSGEKTKNIELHGVLIGRYYIERNLVTLYINPFKNCHLKDKDKLKDDEFISKLLNDLFQIFKTLGVKKTKNEQFLMKLMINTFNKESKKRISTLKTKIRDTDNNIHSYEDSLTQFYTNKVNFKNELKVLDVVEEDSITHFLAEIKKLKKQKIVENVSLDNGSLNITFKPTTIKAPIARNVEGEPTENIYEMYLGKITCKLSGGTKITVDSDVKTENGNPHPHATENGSPCLGSGEGPSTMHKLIGEKKFSDFIYVFWMWIKRWRPEDCYVRPVIYIDDRLEHGYPVFDQLGKRLYINDESHIKAKHFIKLKKEADYEANLEKYKNFKSQV